MKREHIVTIYQYKVPQRLLREGSLFIAGRLNALRVSLTGLNNNSYNSMIYNYLKNTTLNFKLNCTATLLTRSVAKTAFYLHKTNFHMNTLTSRHVN